MNWVIYIGGALVIMVIVGFVGIRILTKSLGKTLGNATADKLTETEITRVLRKASLMISIVLLINLVPWSFILTTGGSMLDQFFRNKVNHWTSGPDIFRHLAIKQNDYHALPLYWKQALSEITVRDGEDEEEIKQFISSLDSYDLSVLDLVASYALGGTLVVERTPNRSQQVGKLTSRDIAHLVNKRIISSALPINHITLGTKGGNEGNNSETPTKQPLVGIHYGMLFYSNNEKLLSYYDLSELGKRIVKSMRKTTSILYLCRLQKHLLEDDIFTEVIVIEHEGAGEGMVIPVANVDQYCPYIIESEK